MGTDCFLDYGLVVQQGSIDSFSETLIPCLPSHRQLLKPV